MLYLDYKEGTGKLNVFGCFKEKQKVMSQKRILNRDKLLYSIMQVRGISSLSLAFAVIESNCFESLLCNSKAYTASHRNRKHFLQINQCHKKCKNDCIFVCSEKIPVNALSMKSVKFRIFHFNSSQYI